jgi:hypothetical protein
MQALSGSALLRHASTAFAQWQRLPLRSADNRAMLESVPLG